MLAARSKRRAYRRNGRARSIGSGNLLGFGFEPLQFNLIQNLGHLCQRRLVDPHWFRGSSYLKIGWSWVKRAMINGWDLFSEISFTTMPIAGYQWQN
jgi:hypothetical protein